MSVPVMIASSAEADSVENGRNASSNAEYVWQENAHEHHAVPTGPTTPSDCQNEALCDIGSSLIYKGTLGGSNFDYRLHDFVMSNTYKGRLQDKDCSVDSVGLTSHGVEAVVQTNNDSEIHPNHFDDDVYAGGTPAEGSPLPYIDEDVALAAIQGAVTTLNNYVSVGVAAIDVLNAMSNDKPEPPVQKSVGFGWDYWSTQTEPSNYMHVLWKAPNNETSEVTFRANAEATIYSAITTQEFELQTDGNPCPPYQDSSDVELAEVEGVRVPSRDAVLEVYDQEDLPRSSTLSADADGKVVKYADPSLVISDIRGTEDSKNE